MIACVRRANENAGNLISVVQFSIIIIIIIVITISSPLNSFDIGSAVHIILIKAASRLEIVTFSEEAKSKVKKGEPLLVNRDIFLGYNSNKLKCRGKQPV